MLPNCQKMKFVEISLSFTFLKEEHVWGQTPKNLLVSSSNLEEIVPGTEPLQRGKHTTSITSCHNTDFITTWYEESNQHFTEKNVVTN